jgi:DNA helicase-2/ATP-dependent DNA helicase PcrA
LEEERRLAYVGITRARKKAFISFAANRLTYGNWVSALPSRFVDELPAGHVEVQSDSGLYGAGRSQHWDSSGMHAASRTPQRAPERSFDRKVTNDAGDEFSRGTRVMHNSFGAGTVVHVDGHKLDIKFDRGGNKRVMDSFVTVIGD